jgi:DNA primase
MNAAVLTIDPLAPSARTALVNHYQRVIPWLAPHAENTPLVVGLYPNGLDGDPAYWASLHEPAPSAMPTIDVPAHGGGTMKYLAFHERAALWEIHRGAFELHSWTPQPGRPDRAQFARIVIKSTSPNGLATVKAAALALRSTFNAHDIELVAGVDPNGMTLWIPFTDGPEYVPMRQWLHGIADATIEANPEIFTRAHDLHRVRVDLGSNAVGRWSAWPYSIRGDAALTMLTPITWSQLESAVPASLHNPPPFDVFAAALAGVPDQRFAPLAAHFFVLSEADVTHGHSHVVDALKQLMADGKAHAAEDLCAAGIAAKLLPPQTKPDYIINAVRGLIGREQLRGDHIDFVELADGRFRLNVPVEPFPSEHEAAPNDPNGDALIKRLRDTANRKIEPGADDKGNFGAPFERAVADAFAWLGFIAERDGRHAAPDVVVTAPLGATAYTVAIECKSFDGAAPHVQYVSASEAARFRDQIGAQYAILIGAGFPGDKPLDDELAAHSVALWSVEDLISLIEIAALHPIAWPDLIPLFAAGRATQRIADFVFNARHGKRERARVILRTMLAESLAYQRSLSVSDVQVERTDAHLTLDALALLVNQRLERDGDLARASADDIREALAFAESPLIDAARISENNITIVSDAGPQVSRV